MIDSAGDLAGRLQPLVAAYCRRPAVRHELGLPSDALLQVTILARRERALLYMVRSEDGRRFVARLATGSPWELSSAKQTAYEAYVLRLVERLQLAPRVCFVDATLYHLPYGLLLREYLPGVAPDYQDGRQLTGIARALARLHNWPVPVGNELRMVRRPLSETMVNVERLLPQLATSPAVPMPAVRMLERALRAAGAIAANEAEAQAVSLVHGDPQLDNWLVAESLAPPLALQGLGQVGEPLPRLIDWEQARVDDFTLDLCLFNSSAQARWLGEKAPSRAAYEHFLGTYFLARPDLDRGATYERLQLRQRFVDLLAVASVATAAARQADEDAANRLRLYLEPSWLRQLFGEWIDH